MLDQKKLPTIEEWLPCDTIEQMYTYIFELSVRGGMFVFLIPRKINSFFFFFRRLIINNTNNNTTINNNSYFLKLANKIKQNVAFGPYCLAPLIACAAVLSLAIYAVNNPENTDFVQKTEYLRSSR